MRHWWPARSGFVALALLAGLGACTDAPTAPAARPEADADAGILDLGGAFLTVSAGLGFSCGTTLDGGTYCWGENGSGQLGTGDAANRATPARVSGVPAALAVSTGAAHACALTATGAAWCWGDNSVGQLGDGSTTSSATAVQVQRPAGVRFVALTTGAVHGCALGTDGRTWCWGDNSVGQLGDGTTNGSAVPVRVQTPAGLRLLAPRSGDGAAHTCAVTSRGAGWCWGDNGYGQLGTGAAGAPSAVPVQVAAPAGVRFAAVTGSGIGHSCAVTSRGDGYCWGDNSNGQLGDGTTTQRLAPTPVLGGRRYTSLEAGWFHSCGSTAVSGAWCWGDANGGKLGNGVANGFSATPVAVAASQGFGRMDPGADHTCARRVDLKGYCWGQGFSGQLGDGTMTNSAMPARVAAPGASMSLTPSFGRGDAGAAETRGIAAWCRARAERGGIAVCS